MKLKHHYAYIANFFSNKTVRRIALINISKERKIKSDVNLYNYLLKNYNDVTERSVKETLNYHLNIVCTVCTLYCILIDRIDCFY